MVDQDDKPKPYRCPLCDHTPAKKFYLRDKVANIGGNLDMGEMLGMSGMPSGGANINLIPHPSTNFYYDCSGCNHQYEDISGIDLENVLTDLEISQVAIEDTRYYYGAIELAQLLRDCNTGIIRRKRDAISYLSRKQEKIMICIKHNNIRTYASCRKKTDRRKHSHYEVMNLGRV